MLLYVVARAVEILRRGRVNTWTKKRRPARQSADVCWFLDTCSESTSCSGLPVDGETGDIPEWGVLVLKRVTAQLSTRRKGNDIKFSQDYDTLK